MAQNKYVSAGVQRDNDGTSIYLLDFKTDTLIIYSITHSTSVIIRTVWSVGGSMQYILC